MTIAFVFPGQGSQSLGMLSSLAQLSGQIQATFAEASDVLGFDLWKLCQEGPLEALNATEVTQPAMLAAGVATYRLWRERDGAIPALLAGHSLGEFTALVAAGSLEFKTAIALVRLPSAGTASAAPATWRTPWHSGDTSSRCAVGGSSRRAIASTVTSASMAPAAPSVWPCIDLVELTASALACAPKASASDSISMASPSRVPAPCAFT